MLKNKRLLMNIFLLLVLAVAFAGCINYEEEIVLKEDGSGTTMIHYSIDEGFIKMMKESDTKDAESLAELEALLSGEKIREALEVEGITVKDIQAWSQTGRHHIIAKIAFKDINKLPPRPILFSGEEESGEKEEIILWGPFFRERKSTLLKEGDTLVYRSEFLAEPQEEEEETDEDLDELLGLAFSSWTFRYILKLPYFKIIYVTPDARVEENTVIWEFPLSYFKGKEKLEMVAISSGEVVPVEPQEPESFFILPLTTGLNFISLPMKPEIPYTARTFAEKLDATLVIRYDTPSQEFLLFVPEASRTDGFTIEGGQGYIVNVLEDKQVTFTGTVWTNAPALSPKQVSDKEKAVWAFAVAGFVSTHPHVRGPFSELIVTVKNQRTGQLSQCTITNDRGEFATAFIDMSRKSVVRVGDILEITIANSKGELVSLPVIHKVSKIDLAKSAVVVNLKLTGRIPQRSQLFQNYPNPFNPETWIPYQLAKPVEVSIRIYNMTGQLVWTLNLGQKPAGNYLDKARAAYWDGRSDAGEKAASGMYFYTIQAGDFTAIRRMLLVK